MKKVILEYSEEVVLAKDFDRNKFYLFVDKKSEVIGFVTSIRYNSKSLKILISRNFTNSNGFYGGGGGFYNLAEIVSVLHNTGEIFEFNTMLEMLEYAVSVLKSKK